jgi:hypothetical protein
MHGIARRHGHDLLMHTKKLSSHFLEQGGQMLFPKQSPNGLQKLPKSIHNFFCKNSTPQNWDYICNFKNCPE